jgi:membrane fusion protein (multidrug efflux system)
MLMTVELRRAERQSPAVPGSAIVRVDEAAFVYVIEEGDQGLHVARRDVELGQRTSDRVEVLAGLEPGDRIVAEGVHRLSPGAPVQIAEETGGPQGAGEATAAGPASAPSAG